MMENKDPSSQNASLMHVFWRTIKAVVLQLSEYWKCLNAMLSWAEKHFNQEGKSEYFP